MLISVTQLPLDDAVCVPPQHPSHSDSSLATGSSEGSLQTTLEEGLSFSVSPPRNLDPPLPPAGLWERVVGEGAWVGWESLWGVRPFCG